MIKLFDRVKVNIPTTGTGDIEFGTAASTAFLTPTEAGVLDGDEVRYFINDGLDFEEGVGLIKDTVATMERTVAKSKIGGVVGTSALNLSGTAVLGLTASAADIGNMKGANNLSDLDDADAALSNLGGTAVGKALFEASNSDAALAELGVGATGTGLFKATDEAAALSEIPSAYHLDNIIGTVDYSGGKNTGAIMESGSNANGSYVKYADGRMECWGFQSKSIGSWSGGSVNYALVSNVALPVSFVAAPAGAVSGSDSVVSSRGARLCSFAFAASSITSLYIISTVTSPSSANVEIFFYASGRWRA